MSARMDDVVAAARTVVRRARKEGKLDTITIKLVRRQIESDLGLVSGGVDVYKSEIKKAVDDALDESDKENTSTATSNTVQNAPLSRSDPNVVKPQSKKRKSEPTGLDPAKKAKVANKIVPISPRGMRDRAVDHEEALQRNTSGQPSRASETTTQQDEGKSGKHGIRDSALSVVQNADNDLRPATETGSVSDTELSSVYDEPRPAKKTKGKSTKTGDTGKKGHQAPKGNDKKSDKVTDKDEEMIRKLKRLVFACGVRKVWSKELAACQTPSQQISRLKQILADLGMTGRLSDEKARLIKAKRELAQEIEDVVEWEKTKGASATEPRTAAKQARARLTGNEEESENEEEDEDIKVKRNRQADLFAFIGQQSSDEE